MKKSFKRCYFCGSEATTMEHIPPKQLFRGFDCDCITVPSCIKHNCEKSGEDQAIVSSFLIPMKNYIRTTKNNENKFSNNIKKAIRVASSSFERTKYRVLNKPFLEQMPEEIKNLPKVAFLKAPINLINWIRKLTAGIVYDGIGKFDDSINWETINCWSTEYYDSKLFSNQNDKVNLLLKYENIMQWLNTKEWINGWSAYPRKYPTDIYSFYFCFDFGDITIKHCFYENYNFYASFNLTNENKIILLNKLNAKQVSQQQLDINRNIL